ncbi:hypothetical protein [Pseudarthrobacter defluvii]|uniref:hypothetical protein n=1 Tax=Pseudarthrobacter defluvii TaxID=410837 RepID=UPI0027D87E56|nr:hypothetical protein [Pseudarthrobacter defluvii]
MTSPVNIMPALAWPVLGCLAAHVLGQVSYPRTRSKPGRQAANQRRILDFLPRRLTWTVLAVFTGAAAQIVWTSTLPGFAPAAYESRPDGAAGYVTFGGEGRIPGVELAAYLGGFLVVLGVGTLLVLALITRRAPLDGLSPELDRRLRTIAMNRLLRTVATVASGLAAIAGNHAARPDPASGVNGWVNPAGALNLAVLLVMLLWAPPRLAQHQPRRSAVPSTSQPATVLSVSIGAATGLAAFAPLPAAIFVPWAVIGHPSLFVTVSAAAVLAVVSLGELLLHHNHGMAHRPRRWPRRAVSPALACTFAVAAAALIAVVVAVAWCQAQLAVQPSWHMTAWTSTGILLFAAVPLVLARRRRSVEGTVLDASLRAVTVHRVVRTLAAAFAAQAGALLMSAGPKLYRASPLTPEGWDGAWQVAPAVGVLLATAGVVIAVIPVQGVRPRRDATSPAAHEPQPVDLRREHPNPL